ncbi:hypothetical protein SAMN05421812_113231 [Asanoa hainanensis]|uniref:Uncharacterized protein n=2 Tax=Asanoa hainanensis TaxID=560556 RepID=A0A239P445_9ACTN|nr:hypothetical protein SAMN05421812_113231 [Asanoa hainanensis]
MFCSALAGALLLATVVFSLRDENAVSWLCGGASLLVWGAGLITVWPVLRAIRTGTAPDAERDANHHRSHT